MRYCKKCVMPDTRPGSIFDSDGVCQACRNYERQAKVDWKVRFEELKALCDRYRRSDGYYDCVIAVSGGKDSHFLTYKMKERMGMNPLLVCVADPFTHTAAGTHNLRNMGESFNCDMDYGQIDSLAYIVHLWMKYPKFGFARAPDVTARWIRKGKITRKEAQRLVMEHDHKLDQRTMNDLTAFMGYRPRQFWDIVERFWNATLFENVEGVWRLKNPVYSDLV
jgi:tRNA(Ile)-lysidine synthase TilS/MesJ